MSNINDKEPTNSILEDVWAVKDRIAKQFNYDIEALGKYYAEKQKERENLGIRYVTLPPKKSSQRTGTDS